MRSALASFLVLLGIVGMPIGAVVLVATGWPVILVCVQASLLLGLSLYAWPTFLGLGIFFGAPLAIKSLGIGASSLLVLFPVAVVCIGIGIAASVRYSDSVGGADPAPSPVASLPRAIAREV